jgi:hypothetical protein
MSSMKSVQDAINCTDVKAYTKTANVLIEGIGLWQGKALVVFELHFLVGTSLPPDGLVA